MSLKEKKELLIRGAPVSEGIAIGSAYFLKPIEEEIPDFEISLNEVDAEIARYRKALFSSKEDLRKLRQDLVMEGSEEAAGTIEAHIEMLDDPMITTQIEGEIRHLMRNTESVFRVVIDNYATCFSERTGPTSLFQERLIDVMDVSRRILGHLRDKQDAQLLEVPAGSIVFAIDIAPSHTASAHAVQVGAFVTKSGGGNSHAALIARSKGLPYVTNIDITDIETMEVDLVIVDGMEGVVILNPREETLRHYQEKQKLLITRYQLFLQQDHLKAETIDGHKASLFVNVGNVIDLDLFPYTHDGVGLFRTEYLFLQTKESYPSEKYQQEVYEKLVEKMGDRPVVLRVFDLGGDKNHSLFHDRQREPNPVLGNRGIRFLLRNRQLFKIQLRAIFKAAVKGNIHLLLPLISDINELRLSKEIIEEVKADLRKDFDGICDLPIGCMIEVPSAVMICDTLSKECDFFSLGTNDLVQYTLGVDRGNPSMSELYYPAHPSVLRMIKMIATEAKRWNKPFTACGEMASNNLFIPLLLGLGISHFSVALRYLPLVKQTVRKWSVIEAYNLAQMALGLTDPKEISRLLTEAQKSKNYG